jgi:Peptidase family M23
MRHILGPHARSTGRGRWRRLAAVVVPAVSFAVIARGGVDAAQTTALAVQVPTPARAVYGGDGREHVEYDLLTTNGFTAPVQLVSLQVRGGGRVLLTLRGKALAAFTFPLFGATSTATISPSSSVKTLVDVVLPRSFGRTWPKQLTNVLGYSLPPNTPVRAAIGSMIVHGPTIQTSSRAPILIASPLRGSGWIDANGCCGDPTSPHRQALLPMDGSYRTLEIFAIDWIREINGTYFKGDGTKRTDYVYYGTPIHAVANGVVVSAINNRPEVPPNITTDQNHTLHTPADLSGNSVIEKIAPGEYAAYAHMQTGSLRVQVGQRIRTGQVIGLLGNSGNTTAPHLHFGIVDGPSFYSNSLPFALSSFIVQGRIAGAGPTPGTIRIIGQPRRATRAEPLVNTVLDLGH